jgi:paraquat-inducible protein B
VTRKPSPTRIGAFILGGALLVVTAVIIWGSGRLFERRYRYVCYFPGTVNGLNVGAAVRYRGVPVGQVSGIRIRYEQPLDDHRIPVFIELSEKRLADFGDHQHGPAIVRSLIDRGLRARLDVESFVTGQLYVNLDLFPETPRHLVHSQPGYPEIPTIPTPLEEATKSVAGLLSQLRETDLAGIARSLASAIEGINRLVNTPSIAHTLKELPPTVASVRQLVETTDQTLSPRGAVVTDLQRALVDVQRAADAVRRFAEFLERNPNSLIVGKKRP